MKTKKEILKMSKKELKEEYYKVPVNREDKNCSNCSYCHYCSNCSYCHYCSYCFDCSYCSNCSDCFNCSYCTSQKDKRYMILDIQLTKEEYEKKIKEIKGENKE